MIPGTVRHTNYTAHPQIHTILVPRPSIHMAASLGKGGSSAGYATHARTARDQLPKTSI